VAEQKRDSSIALVTVNRIRSQRFLRCRQYRASIDVAADWLSGLEPRNRWDQRSVATTQKSGDETGQADMREERVLVLLYNSGLADNAIQKMKLPLRRKYLMHRYLKEPVIA
jgi:hypothetical protein